MNVVFATDGSPEATHAMREGIRLLALREAHVTVVSVYNLVGALPAYDGLGAGGMVLAEKLEEVTRQDLASAVAIFAEAGIEVGTRECQGDPAHAIMKVARDEDADMIVVGSHGAGPIERLLLGSVGNRITHTWPGAVLVIKPPKQAA